jgi:RNA polymerase sigma-70 factor (ECF subfamily)
MEELGKLNHKYRIPIILKYFGGFSEEEIGIILELPKSTIKSRLYTGRIYIKKGFMNDREV